MISVICVYNNINILNKYLLRTLRRQDSPFQSITIDNTSGKYKSAPKILNDFAGKARHDYIMFVHQDVGLRSDTWLTDVEAQIKTLDRFGAAGAAGKHVDGRFASSIWHGDPPEPINPARLREPVPVQTIDGCLMIVSRAAFQKMPFDEQTCKGWYLYVADYCLDLGRSGRKVYVLPNEVHHESPGPSDPKLYMNTVRDIVEKHKEHTPVIRTTIGEWDTRTFQLSSSMQPLPTVAPEKPRNDQEPSFRAAVRRLRKIWRKEQ
ncbi:MAG: hypothetical protein WAW37_03860 [Syntrophobacteraceae bacterium]